MVTERRVRERLAGLECLRRADVADGAGSSVNPTVAVVVQAPAIRAADAISQFCDSQAEKSVNSRRW